MNYDECNILDSDEDSDNEVSTVPDPSMQKLINIRTKLTPVDPEDYGSIVLNTKVCYINNRHKAIFLKTFRGYDKDINVILLHYKYNYKDKFYKQPIEKINQLYIYNNSKIVGGTPEELKKKEDLKKESLKNTIVIKEQDWDNINTGTTISYLKTNGDMTYKVRFNNIHNKDIKKYSFINKTNGIYFISPFSIAKMYRHILAEDFQTINLLNSIKQINIEINELKKSIHKIDVTLTDRINDLIKNRLN